MISIEYIDIDIEEKEGKTANDRNGRKDDRPLMFRVSLTRPEGLLLREAGCTNRNSLSNQQKDSNFSPPWCSLINRIADLSLAVCLRLAGFERVSDLFVGMGAMQPDNIA